MLQEAHSIHKLALIGATAAFFFLAGIGSEMVGLPRNFSVPFALLIAISFAAITFWRTHNDAAAEVPSRARSRKSDWARIPIDIDEALYWDLFENASDIVFTTDISGHFVTGNRAVERLLGYTVQEAQQLTWEKLVAPYEMDKAREMFKRHASGERFIHYELDVIVKSGEIRTFEIGSRPLFENDRLLGFHGIARDVTERKRIQQAAIIARREAEQASRAKSFFLANMSHEIRTPINGILGFLSLLSKTSLDKQQRGFLHPIEQSASNLMRIVDDILDLSKIEAGKITIDRENICLREIVEDAVELQQTFAQEKSLELHVEFDESIPSQLVGDATRIAQILGNLVNNAIKFTEQGEVLVQVKLLDLAAESVKVCLSVHDTGIGIPNQLRRQLFEPFQQLEPYRDRRSTGSGLGLTITKNLVTAMGGEIDISSEPGVYTAVRVVLPLTRFIGELNFPSLDNQDFNGQGLLVLVVDDNEINLRYLVALLQSLGTTTLEAKSGYEALELTKNESIDLILMDIHMAGMDGVQATQKIRALPRKKKLPVVAVSADVMGDKAAWREQGFDGFICKPVQEHTLTRLMIELFSGRAKCGEKSTTNNTAEVSLPENRERKTLDTIRGIKLASGNKELWRKSIERLLDTLPDHIKEMRDALAQRDYFSLKELAHRMKGSARYIAASELEHCAQEVEKYSCEACPEKLSLTLGSLEAAAERFCKHAKTQLKNETQ